MTNENVAINQKLKQEETLAGGGVKEYKTEYYPHFCYDCMQDFIGKTRLENCPRCGGTNVVNCFKEKIKTRKTRVYIAMPLSNGDALPIADRKINVIKAVEVCNQLWVDGYLPLCPHLTYQWDEMYSRKYQDCLDYDRPWQELCDCTLRLGGASDEADSEVQYAEVIKQPTFTSYGELLEKMPKEIKE